MVSGRTIVGVAVVLVAVTVNPRAVQEEPWTERVQVSRVLIDARVFGPDGRQLTDLGPDDFRVTIDGKPARVESAEWIGVASTHDASLSNVSPAPGGPIAAPRPGRLVVCLVQKDFESFRIVGLMQMAQLADRMLETMTPRDRAAVLSFDTSLHIWSDFTNNFRHVRSILAKDVITSHPGAVQASRWPSLMERLDTRTAAGVNSIEHALRHIAEALAPLPGAKSLVFLGYGFGRLSATSGAVILMDGYGEASAALQRARVSVFTLNVTQAHYNSLQAGLETVAAETGGLYSSTFEFPNLAIRQVNNALAGHYVLFVEAPPVDRGEHRIDVKLTRARGTVTARASYAAVY